MVRMIFELHALAKPEPVAHNAALATAKPQILDSNRSPHVGAPGEKRCSNKLLLRETTAKINAFFCQQA
jgi:hypothetical protein